MESRLKERLTGAAILVALIVLVVPEMFHGPGSAGPAGGATAAAEGAPVRSYTIDLSDSAAHPSPPEAAPSAAAQGSAAGSAGLAASTAAPASTAPESPAGAVGAASPPAPEARAAREAPAASEPPAAHGHAAAPASEVRGRPATAAVAPAGWSVQLGLFAKDGNAQRLMLTARAKGFSTRISRTEPKGLYRVWIAGLADRPAAEQMSRKLHAAGLPAAVIRVR